MYRLQTKDIATLYEIWCFIEVSHIVKELIGLNDEDVEHQNRMEMNGLFTWELGKGEHSKILFRKDNVELAELVYNPKHTDKENDDVSIQNFIVPTVPQKPDIVLQLTKNDLQKDMKMTYLFDAKYRIEGRVNGVDTPPDDAINQMHRYRDAIYYQEHKGEMLKKEVIGGYILFPGDGERTEVEVSKFYKTINQVNIGAFPLRPKDEENRKLLVNFIRELINANATDLLDDSIPQKGLYYTTEFNDASDLIVVASCKDEEQRKWIVNNHWYNVPLAQVNETPLMMKAKYILLHVKGESESDYLFPIVKGKYEVWTKEKLQSSSYLHPSHDAYFMFRIGDRGRLPKEAVEKSFKFAEAKYISSNHKQPIAFVKYDDLM